MCTEKSTGEETIAVWYNESRKDDSLDIFCLISNVYVSSYEYISSFWYIYIYIYIYTGIASHTFENSYYFSLSARIGPIKVELCNCSMVPDVRKSTVVITLWYTCQLSEAHWLCLVYNGRYLPVLSIGQTDIYSIGNK